MCGIAGFAGIDNPTLLRAMCRALTHRGPDDEGYYEAPGVGMGMRRLSVIDLKTGHQPISNEAGDVWVVFNGEIYNYQQLTAELKLQGHVFRTTSDTETIVHLYEEHGVDFVDHLRGMFGVAVWDVRRRRLVLARDRIGEKPLHYSLRDGVLYFGSEIKAILQRGGERRVNAQAVCSFLAASYVEPPHTFFSDVQKLAPGHRLVYEDGDVCVEPYWRRGRGGRCGDSFREASESFSALLRETVGLCLKSDVEVGAFLSGGIDSSVLVALMAQHDARVQTFTVGYRGLASGFNELRYARSVADAIGTEHHELILEPQATADLLPRVIWYFDEPHGEPTSILVYLLCEFTRRRVKVAVGGTGGDETMFGYPRHKGIRLLNYYRRLPSAVRSQLVSRVVSRWPESTRGSRFAKRAKRFVRGADLPPAEAYLSWASLLSREVRAELISDTTRDLADRADGEAFLRRYLTDEDRGDVLYRAADLDVEGYLPEYQLTYMDRMSMAHGLEVRSPLCDYRLVDYVLSLPAEHRLRGTRSKHLLKTVAKQWISKSIAERKKVGFDSPIGQWVKGELREFVCGFLSKEHVERSGLLKPAGVERVLADHFSGSRDYSLQLWSILALETWYRMYIEDRVTDGDGYRLTDLRGSEAGASRAAVSLGGDHDLTEEKVPLPGVRPSTPRFRSVTRYRIWSKSPRILRRAAGKLLQSVPAERLLGREFRRYYRFLEESQWWSAERIEAYQVESLRRILTLAQKQSPYYRERFGRIGFDARDFRGLGDMPSLPTIDRKTLSENLDRMCTRAVTDPDVDCVSTGGTGGHPLRFYIGADRSVIEFAYLTHSWRRAGYRLGTPLAVFRGNVVEPDATGLRHDYDPLLRHHYYSSFHMTDADMSRYLEHVRQIGLCYIHAYPSSATALARFLVRSRTSSPGNILGVITESEITYPEQRKLIEEVFGCKYFSCYGHSEKLVAAAPCEQSEHYHVWPTYGYFELLDEDGQRVTTPGEQGEIVGTGFINTVTPFIRYRTGDFAVYVDARCAECVRQHPIIKDIQGHRIQEYLLTKDGSALAWTALNMHDNTFANVQQFQFCQERIGHAQLLIVPTSAFTQNDLHRIKLNLSRKLGQQLAIDLRMVEAIAQTQRGKAIYVDQRIANRFPNWH